MALISVVLCVKNSQSLIARSISALIAEGIHPSQIIVVDGNSEDNSVEIASSLGCTTVSDDGLGFVFARSLGISLVETEYTLIIGPDDELQPGSVAQLFLELSSDPNTAAVQSGKRVDPGLKGFLYKGMDYYYSQVQTGVTPVVGTPSLYRTRLLSELKFDRKYSANEDTDWCFRVKEYGYYVKRSSSAVSHEFESFSWGAFAARWIWYGKGDLIFIRESIHKKEMGRAVRHLLHPLREYGVRLALRALLRGKLRESLFLLICASFRYFGLVIAFFNTVMHRSANLER